MFLSRHLFHAKRLALIGTSLQRFFALYFQNMDFIDILQFVLIEPELCDTII